ncbi:MAG: hypothetical protein LBL39_07590 [Planctomycetaceae bacterium]|jgi:hypothetical protein|nr:hypothetical protein [Planctomycetaceae bacterium]
MSKLLRYTFGALGKIRQVRGNFPAVLQPIVFSILFFILVVILRPFYLIEENIGSIDRLTKNDKDSTDHAGYWLNKKTAVYHNDYTLYCYDLSVICHSKFYLSFNIYKINRQDMKTYTSSDNGATVSLTVGGSSDEREINFNSKRWGIFYQRVDVLVIATSDGSFCVLDKKADIPISQLRDICKKNSLLELDHDIPLKWIFENDGFRNITTMMIGARRSFSGAYGLSNAYASKDSLGNPLEQPIEYHTSVAVEPIK